MKVDHLTNRLSVLRKQIESEKSMVEKKQDALSEFMSSINTDMKTLSIELTELQTKRVQLIYSQLTKFGCAFKEFNHGNKKRRTEIGEIVGCFESICIDEIIERVKQDVEARANTRMVTYLSYSTCALPKQENINNTPAVQSMMGRTQTTVESSENSSLESKIETIVIPNEPGSDCKMPPPFPTKEFCVSSGDEGNSCMEEQHEADDLSCRWYNTNQRLHTNSTDDVSMIRNVKVIAIHDFFAGKGDQISFKKGMVVIHL
ncbi:unnamed protein product [Mytilus coruscus]|uniref:Uncharacterized protein n=1 Tax=Mytilus coruscus TaxID=42192 RepID=A0A6J8ERG8_MYTCO|nr:unnamed protein product [Mytilus coruscus]